jgi:hypothetical protein
MPTDGTKSPLFEKGLPATLVRLNEFADSVHRGKFKTAADSTIELVDQLAADLCSNLPKSKAAVVKKSLQEMLFAVTGLKADLTASAFAKKLKASLLNKGSKGWIVLFLKFHTENTLHRKLDVRRSSISALKTWPKLTPASAEKLIDSLT